MVVGLRTLGDKMKRLSIEAKLSYVYTNHSIRATTITILDECGYRARHIMEGLLGVLGNKGTKGKYRREQGNMTPVLGNA